MNQEKNSPLAAIDVGSNSIILLIAFIKNGTITTPLYEEVRITRLGERLASDRQLPAEAISLTLTALIDYTVICQQYNVETIYAAATSAVREAENGVDFISIVKQHTGIDLHIINGEEEAYLSLLGVLSDGKQPYKEIAVLDIGGGSSEIIIGNTTEVSQQTSVPMGSVRLRRLLGDATNPGEIVKLVQAAEGFLAPVISPLASIMNTCPLIGVGGSITSLGSVFMGLPPQNYQSVNGLTLTKQQITHLANDLAVKTIEQRMRVAGLPHGREDTIIAGTAILLAALHLLSKESLTVSTRGLCYGVLVQASGNVRWK